MRNRLGKLPAPYLKRCQVIMATHAPMLMAYPGAQLLGLSRYGLDAITVDATDHYRLMREFCTDPQSFIAAMLSD
jgi:predicted ATPase